MIIKDNRFLKEVDFVNKNDLLKYDLADADIPLAEYVSNIKVK